MLNHVIIEIVLIMLTTHVWAWKVNRKETHNNYKYNLIKSDEKFKCSHGPQKAIRREEIQ